MEVMEKLTIYAKLLLNVVENHFLYFPRYCGDNLWARWARLCFSGVEFAPGVVYQKSELYQVQKQPMQVKSNFTSSKSKSKSKFLIAVCTSRKHTV